MIRIRIFLFILLPALLSAQLIAIKTVPVASGDQFLLFPSQNAGMAGTSLALEDALYDPFSNPALGSHIRGSHLIMSPAWYRITDDMGSGRTLPFHLLSGYENWFGGLSMAIQQLSPSRLNNSSTIKDQHVNNSYLNLIAGHRFPESGWSAGTSVFWSSLNALQGVDLLYANSQRIDQSGNIYMIKTGVAKEWPNQRRFELVAMYHKTDMKHEVMYAQRMWLGLDNTSDAANNQTEINLDKTSTWGIHLGYRQPIASSDWKIGTILTANLKTHPKIPNYELMNIPRDPGHSTAFNIGIGFGKTRNLSTIGIDFIYEPIYSHTWAIAGDEVSTLTQHTIYPGQKTVDNKFEFSNFMLRLGFTSHGEPLGIQLGLAVHEISYWLDQNNYLQETKRTQYEEWQEWMASIGFIWRSDPFEIRYALHMTSGTGLPGSGGVNWGITGDAAMADYAASGDFLLAPQNSLSLQESWVFSHQIMVTVPLGN